MPELSHATVGGSNYLALLSCCTLQEEIARLKAELAARQQAGAGGVAVQGDAQVVERVVEVEPDKAAIVEQLRQQMKEEMEQQQQQLEGQALEAARQEAEARAKQQLEVTCEHDAHATMARHALPAWAHLLQFSVVLFSIPCMRLQWLAQHFHKSHLV
jgi:hypothetical protein